MTLSLTSAEAKEGERIPERHTCDGDDYSPSFGWDGEPDGTQSFALLCDDPDAPDGTWRHWAVYDIPANTKWLGAGLGTGAQVGPMRQALNDFGNTGYGGPCPPEGHGDHHYRFRLLALSVAKLELGASPSCADVEEAATSHVLEEVVLTSTYSRG